MRLEENTQARFWSGPWLAIVLSAMSLVAGGCYNGGLDLAQVGEINSFFDPTEPNIRPLHSSPLVKPILDTLDPAVEEPVDLFNNATDVEPEDLKAQVGDYRVGKNDLINVGIYDLLGEGTGETAKSVRVSESGYISLDFIKPVYALGLTEDELQDAIKQAYADAGQIRNARVTVTVAEQRARIFTIYGNVGTPGQFQITQNDFRMLDALVVGHGPSNPEGVDYAYVIRQPVKPPGQGAPTTAPSPESSQPSSPSDQSLPAPTTQLLEPPHTQANPTDSVRYLDASATAPSAGNGLLAPDTTAPASGVVEGQPLNIVPQTAPTSGAGVSSTTASGGPTSEPNGFGGFKFNAANESDVRVIRVPIKELRDGHLEYNIVIQPGDLIFVPDPISGEYYMGGHVQRTGVYSLTGRKLTLKQAVISAGMFDQAAIPGRSEVIRRVGPNKEVYFRLDLDKIWSGQQPDLYLKPYDVLQVGTNELAPFIAAFRNAFRVSYGFGFTYDVNYAPNNGNVIP